MRNSLLIFSLILTSNFVFSQNSVNNTLENKYDKILHKVAKMLTEEHYTVKLVDNNLSEKVFNDYIKKLDSDKSIFLKKDIKNLEKYKFLIDEEINGGAVKFFNEANSIYLTRIKDINNYFPKLLAKSLNFNDNDSISFNFEKLDYASKLKNQKLKWAKKLKYYNLQRYYDLVEARKNTKNDSLKNRSNETLLQLAKTGTEKSMAKYFDRILRIQNDENRFGVFVNSLVYQYDPHSGYFGVIEKRSWDERLSGKFYGIGATIVNEDGLLKVAGVNEGGPAWKSGEVKEGDIFLKVGDFGKEAVDVQGFETDDLIKLIRGEKGTNVVITFRGADGANKVVSMVRNEIKIEETFAKGALIEKDSTKIGYIYLPKFYMAMNDMNGRKTSTDMEKIVKDLTTKGAQNIVIDLRNNGGGSLSEVIKATGLFVNGPIVQVRNRNDQYRTFFDSDNNKIVFDGPLTVLVNEYSASASEIFAAGIQDHGRGIIVGSSSTYGKGTVQRPTPIYDPKQENLGSLHITYQKYYRINGSTVQLKGVVPDVILPSYFEDFKIKEKDKSTALAFDEIKKLDYKISDSKAIEITKLGALQAKVNADTLLLKSQEYGKWMASQNNTFQSLNFKEYSQNIQRRKDIANAYVVLGNNKDGNFKISWFSIPSDSDKNKEANTRWEKSLLKDIVLNYSLDLFLKEEVKGQ